MERRSFIPSTLGLGFELEHRMLLASSIIGTGPTRPVAIDFAQTLALRLQRIDHLPFILTSIQPGRTIPAETIGPIQDDLRSTIATLRSPSKPVLTEFNHTLRSVMPLKTLSPSHARSLVNAFDAVLADAGMNDVLRAKFVYDVTNLSKVEAIGPEPTVEATNDYAILSQLTIAVGQPFQPPGAPTLSAGDRIAKTERTHNHQPHFTGLGSGLTDIQIVDAATGLPIATGAVPKNGVYTVQSQTYLPDGTYTVRARTLDTGYASLLSKPFTFKVVTPPTAYPRGPRR